MHDERLSSVIPGPPTLIEGGSRNWSVPARWRLVGGLHLKWLHHGKILSGEILYLPKMSTGNLLDPQNPHMIYKCSGCLFFEGWEEGVGVIERGSHG